MRSETRTAARESEVGAAVRGALGAVLVAAALGTGGCSPKEAPPSDAPAAAPAPATKTPEAPSAPAAPAARVPDAPGTFEVRYYVLDQSCPYCRDLRRVIEGGPSDGTGDAPAGEAPLAKLYEGKVRFDFRRAFLEDTTRNPEMEPFGFAESAHGFAGIAPDGTVRFTMPGHHHTRGELVSAIDGMLK